jgi:hypothetical protein
MRRYTVLRLSFQLVFPGYNLRGIIDLNPEIPGIFRGQKRSQWPEPVAGASGKASGKASGQSQWPEPMARASL